MDEKAVPARLVWALGVSQLLCWGVSYYLIGLFGEAMAADLGQGLPAIHGGFTLALVVMGLVSSAVGRAIDRRGGRAVMVAGSLLMAAGCVGLALAHGLLLYYAAWVLLGLAMRMALYDAAFAALARIGGRAARTPISQITLLGGLASSVMWPVGQWLAEGLGWRGALYVYALLALATIPLHLLIPPDRHVELVPSAGGAAGAPPPSPPSALAAILYALIVALTGMLNSGLSAHMIGMLTGLGMLPALAVWVSTLRGVGQSAARLAEIQFGKRLSAFGLSILATGLIVPCFLLPVGFGAAPAAGIGFALLFGAGNGLVTIVRGALPLSLFDPARYGQIVGRLITPGFFVSALAPLFYALVIEHFGDAAALWLSFLLALAALAAALVLALRFGGRNGA
ncbi:putative MFS family arabinose efflux permease [Azospirillum lipoferum]|uniref:MFS transporter n=1 Tax=Azospirillum TaxID=191 RepID=UPI001B3BA148|nr:MULTISPECIES: MFS transporter [Azospirillum]MCP1608583.1 putative MFS family arabinose efflux permease [Azospirillum lipoferum]MDW5536099.1 MFS transporter [Azospirillum sp. NL1]